MTATTSELQLAPGKRKKGKRKMEKRRNTAAAGPREYKGGVKGRRKDLLVNKGKVRHLSKTSSLA